MPTFFEFLKYFVLGIIQGFTEPLPISSSGHLVIFQNLFNIETIDYFFEVLLHFASLLAIMFLFRKKLIQLLKGNIQYIIRKNKDYYRDFHYVVLLVIALIPIAITGYFFNDIFATFFTLLVVGISLVITGSILFLIKRQSTENTRDTLTYFDALTIGLFQVFSLLPGISRSGSTLVGGLLKKVRFETVIEFSFMLYIPVSFGAMLLGIIRIEQLSNLSVWLLGTSFLASVLATYFAFKFFVSMVRKGNLHYFAIYCVIVGVITIFWSLFS